MTKSIQPSSILTLISFTRIRSPTSNPWAPWTTLPSTGGLRSRTQVPLSEAPVTMASKCSPMRWAKSGAGGLSHLAFHLVRGVFLLGAMGGQGGQFGDRRGRGWAKTDFRSRWVIRSG